MPKRISAAKRKRAIDLRMNGEGLQEIASKLGISLGSVHGIINGERAAVPDIEELRELGLSLREADVGLEEAREGAELLQTIKSLGIPLDRLSEAVDFYERHGQNPEELISLGKRIDDLASQYNRSPEEIIAEAEASAEELGSAHKNISDGEKAVRDLQIQIISFKALLTLQNKLSEHKITIGEMDNFIIQNSRLLELDFTPDVAELFAAELGKYGLDKKQAAAILASSLSKHDSLQEAIDDNTNILQSLADEINTNRGENDKLKKQGESQLEQIEDAKSEHERTKKKMGDELEDLSDKIETAKDALEKLNTEINEIKTVRTTLTSDLERIEGIVEKNEYLTTMTALMTESPVPLGLEYFRRASLSFFNGFIKYVQENKQAAVFYSSIVNNAMTIRNILKMETR